ncbi:hypothetical protein M9H77_31947 [Catharanthus roseus]|uniref:Uncharacterized protein n=1 Tax=Catharanthus roseus TaxID=4058 RepID=A0ACC0A1H4_CATRO|nr:hypothetical protein M9H77_31947 [Catharanthus roseus]
MLSPLLPSVNITIFRIQFPNFDVQLPKALEYGTNFTKKSSCTNTLNRNISCFGSHDPFPSVHYDNSVTCSIPSNNIDNHKKAEIFYPSSVSNGSTLLAYLLQSCTDKEEVRIIHAIVLKISKESNIFVDNNLISGYARYGGLVEARKVFDEMLERNVVSWTAMLNAYLRFGYDNEAIRHFINFVESGIPWSSKTFVCMLNMCSKILDLGLGKQVHTCMVKGGFSGLILNSALLYFYVQCGDLENAVSVFDHIKERDVICWTIMISAYSQHRRGEEAFKTFSRMLSDRVEPNEFTICTVLDACGEEKELKLGRQLHGATIKTMYIKDVFIGTALVDMYAKCGETEDSRLVFDCMRNRNTVTWTTIIAGYARNGFGEEAINLFRVMQRRKILANNLTMVSILRACGLLGALPTGKEVHAQIFKNYAQSNIHIGSALVWLYCRCGDYSAASKVLEYMPLRDVVSWTAMISGCTNLGHEHEALEYLKEMLGEGVSPNPFTYSSALKACAQLEDIRQGKLIHSSIHKTPASSSVFVGSALIHMYAKCGHLSEAIRVFDNMPEQNLVSCKAMIIAYAKNGLCREALKLVYRMQAEGIELDDYVLSTVLTECGDFERDKSTKELAFHLV